MRLTKSQLDELLSGTVANVLAALDIDLYLNKKQACRYLSISLSFLEKLMPEIPHFKLGKKVLFRKTELSAWMEQYRVSAEALDVQQIANEALHDVLGDSK